MLHPLLVGIGGFVGSILRYFIGNFFASDARSFPLGTFLVNVLGCLAIGLLYSLSERANFFTLELRFLLITGFLGGFTTFSAFSIETLVLLRRGDFLTAGAYSIGSVIVGLAAAWIGIKLSHHFLAL